MDYKDLFFRFDGRIGRMTFFKAGLALVGLYLLGAILVLFSIVGVKAAFGTASTLTAIIGLVLMLALLVLIVWVSSALTAKRLHDLNKSGWLFAAYLVVSVVVGVLRAPIEPEAVRAIGVVLGLVATLGWLVWTVFIRGTEGANRFGQPDPTVPVRAQTYFTPGVQS